MTTKIDSNRNVVISDPPFAVDLFNNTRWSWLWLLLRLYLGYTWLSSRDREDYQPGLDTDRCGLAGFLAASRSDPGSASAPIDCL